MDYKPYELSEILGLFSLLRESNSKSATERKAQIERKRKVLGWACTDPEKFLAALDVAPDMHPIFARYFDATCRDNGKLISVNRASKARIREALKNGKLPPVIALNGIDYLARINAMAQEAVAKGYITKGDLLKSLGQSISAI